MLHSWQQSWVTIEIFIAKANGSFSERWIKGYRDGAFDKPKEMTPTVLPRRQRRNELKNLSEEERTKLRQRNTVADKAWCTYEHAYSLGKTDRDSQAWGNILRRLVVIARVEAHRKKPCCSP